MSMITFQDFEKTSDVAGFLTHAINEYRLSDFYHIAVEADLYNRQMNVTINEYVRTILSLSGQPIEDFTVSNNKIACNLFRRLNTQRCMYSLGNGISFDEDGIKEKLGTDFDIRLKTAGYDALIHGVSFGFWNVDRLYIFPATEFCPLWDEYDGTLKAGIRFWRLCPDKPVIAILYEIDGFTRFQSEGDGEDYAFKIVEEKKPYKTKVIYTAETDEEEVIGEENYSSLPIVPLWGSELHQSTLVGIKQAIDSYDLIRSGFANDLTDCSQIYWLVKNCGGMTDDDLARFRDRLKINHIASVDGDEGASVDPYTQEIPYNARKVYLDDIRAGIYEDFGGLDVHTISAGATNDHIDAGYQPLNENADDFEYQCIEFIRQILKLQGVEDVTPLFKRNKISNQTEQTTMVLQAAQYLDTETILKHLPWLTSDEVEEILDRMVEEEADRYGDGQFEEEDGQEIEDDGAGSQQNLPTKNEDDKQKTE